MSRLSKIGAACLAAFGWTSGSSVTASYLVVAGGGGGGNADANSNGGGGGAGGLLTGTASLNPTLSYTVTVGGGGAAATSGSNSVFSSITSTGGGYGGTLGGAGASGGSGGGAGGNAGGSQSGGAGTSGQGNNGGACVTAYTGAGGGGAGAAGSASNVSSGAGGAGAASSISGASVTYAGGGGGNSGAGGSGGGGAGGGTPTAGTANLGGGGGGKNGTGTAASGGSGVVIISYPAPQKFGGGIVTTSGSNVIHTFNTSGTLTPLLSLTASYLIVAGGGGGSSATGAGGSGAGGLLSGSGLTIDTNSNYLVTVGAGGAGGGASAVGLAGGNSSFSMVTTTAVGGGRGGITSAGSNGTSGGSGGGGNYTGTGGAGTSGQGYAGGNGTGNYFGGGGGGAGAVGGTASGTTAGSGGVGVASSISGTSTYYAGGGGGAQNGGTAGAGGNGGGGAGGGDPSTAGGAGTANTGGGAGASGYNVAGNSGGSGVVIISYAGSTQQMAGGTVTISGGNVIHTFTSSGYLTPIKYVNNSLRFRSSASAYLNRTPASSTSSSKYTLSMWVKMGALQDEMLFAAGASTANQTYIRVYGGANQAILWETDTSSTSNWYVQTSALFRDPSAWYHFVFAYDSSLSGVTNQAKIYVNGVQASVSTGGTGTNSYVNTTVAHYIGRHAASSLYFDGYMTEVNFIDGQALTPNSFGTFNAYGVWQPITYGGSYGTNGFYLPFTNKTSTTTLGYDFSPNGNNWTTNNISLTAGVTYDSMVDSPTVSAVSSNWCVLNPLVNSSYQNITAGNLNTFSNTATDSGIAVATMGASSGKFYWEATISGGSSGYPLVGALRNIPSSGNGVIPGSSTTGGFVYYTNIGYVLREGTTLSTSVATCTTGDVVGFALDIDNLQVLIYKNNSLIYTVTGLTAGTYFPSTANYNSTGVYANFGQRPFTYTPPTGFVALNTYNM